MKSLSRVRLFATPWTVAHQAALSMGFSSQEYWTGLPFPCPGDLPNLGIELGSPTLQADSFLSEQPGNPYVFSKESFFMHFMVLPLQFPTVENTSSYFSLFLN